MSVVLRSCVIPLKTVVRPNPRPSTLYDRNTVMLLSTTQRDRLTSFRKTGLKKEKPLIQHSTDLQTTPTEMPLPQPLFDDRSLNLSEKEINDLFEKMMVRPRLLVCMCCFGCFNVSKGSV